MPVRHFLSVSAVAFITGGALLTSVTAGAKQSTSTARPAELSSKTATTWTPGRTPWGDPDLQGVYTNIDELYIPLERPARFEGRRLQDVTEAELVQIATESNETARRSYQESFQRNAMVDAKRRFDLKPSRAWLVIDPPDGRIPSLTPEAQQRVVANAARQSRRQDSYEDLTVFNRCLSHGMPRSMMPNVEEKTFRIVQAPGLVAIQYEIIHEARVIPVDAREHVAPNIRTAMGTSRGHWEGGSLVVQTSNFKYVVFPPEASRDLRIVERFRPVAPQTVEWSVTFDDPSSWSRPWTMAMNLTKIAESQEPLEYACHEGNLPTVRGLLTGARVDEKAEEEAAASKPKQ